MDTISKEVLQYMLDFIETPGEVVQFHRLCTWSSTVVNSDYWRCRVSRLLSVEMPSVTIPWSQVCYELVSTQVEEWLTIVLKYLPREVILEWVTVNSVPIDLKVVSSSLRFDVVQDLSRLANPTIYLFGKNLSNVSQKEWEVWEQHLEGSGILDLFLDLLHQPTTPLLLLVELNQTYKFTELAEAQFIATRDDYQLLPRYFTAISPLPMGQALTKTMFLLTSTPRINYRPGDMRLSVQLLLLTDSPLVLYCLADGSASGTQEWIEERLYANMYRLGPNLAKRVVTTLTPEQVHIEVQDLLTSDPEDWVSTPFYACLLQRLSPEVLITQVMPGLVPEIKENIQENVECLKILTEGLDIVDRRRELWETLTLWKNWGISDIHIFLDPRTIPFIDPFYDILRLLTMVGYSNAVSSQYFTFLVRLEMGDNQSEALSDYIASIEPRLGIDTVLWANLVEAGKHSLVSRLTSYSDNNITLEVTGQMLVEIEHR
jgi:hypothetical protein